MGCAEDNYAARARGGERLASARAEWAPSQSERGPTAAWSPVGSPCFVQHMAFLPRCEGRGGRHVVKQITQKGQRASSLIASVNS